MKRKRTTDIIQQAENRAATLRLIEGKLDFGKSLSLAAFTAKIESAREQAHALNALLAATEAARHALDDTEAELKDLNNRILQAVLVQFGSHSEEYVMVGGARPADRKRPTRRPTEPTLPHPNTSPKPA